jgi:flagellar motility protein MotE (MotC chaperone)
MRELAPRYYPSGSPITPTSRFGGQPFVIGAAALLAIVVGIGAIAAWRAYSGTSPELDRVTVTRQLQARATQASAQLVEKTRGLEATQQESIDQLQVMQDQLQTVRRLLASQQADSKKLSEQIVTLTESVESLRQSFASARSDDAAPAVRKSSRKKVYRSAQRKRGKSQG